MYRDIYIYIYISESDYNGGQCDYFRITLFS